LIKNHGFKLLLQLVDLVIEKYNFHFWMVS